MSIYTGNQLITAINDDSILESGIGSHLTIRPCTDQQLATIIDYLVEHDLASSLTHLDLSYNQLTSLPISFGNLNNLTVLILDANKLTSLPLSFCNLNNLTTLYLDFNQLTSLPLSFGNLNNLTVLSLCDSQLTSLPLSFGNLNNLTELFLLGCQLKSLPLSFGNLNNLTKLYLACNQLTSLPDSFGNLKNLTELYLFKNPLETLPIVALSWKNKALIQNELVTKLLKKLQIEAKQFSDIMAGLVATHLDLANKLGHDNKNYCDNFCKIFLSEGNSNPMASRIMHYALQGAEETNEPQLTADKNGFWPFFVKERDLQFKVQEKQRNKKEPEASETRDKQLATTSSITKG